MSARVLLYGANGYTGEAIAMRVAQHTDIVLAGRSADRIDAVAETLKVERRVFDLRDHRVVEANLRDIDIVLNCAGPFDRTAAALISACVHTGTHYMDLGGEWPVFAHILDHHKAAETANIMLLPGIGLTTAATDCLMARAVEIWPDTHRLCVGISRAQVISRGSVATASKLLDQNARIRRDGKIHRFPAGTLTRPFDFGDGLSECAAMSWADIVTGSMATDVPNVEIYSEMNWMERAGYRGSALAMGVTGVRQWREFGGVVAKAWPDAPPENAREAARFVMVVEALDKWRRVRRLRLRTYDGYLTTVLAAAEALMRLQEMEPPTGFQTPARAFGSNFIVDAGAGVYLDEPVLDETGAAVS